MTKDDFIAEQERICDEFAFEKLTREEASDALCRLGFNPAEAEALLNEAVA